MKLFLISVLSFALVIRRCHCSPAKTFSINQYLNNYGYMASNYDEKPPVLVYQKAIAKFQKYAGLLVTGTMNSATEAKLTGPRCGAKDFKLSSIPEERMRRFVKQGSSWQKTDLTYSIHNRQPTRKITSTVVRTALEKTFKMWQDVTQLSFRRLSENDPDADIIIKFGRGHHGDGYPFDNIGGTLAHGFYPHNNKGLSGDVHFDDDEIWTVNGEAGTTDYTWTALHEIGHAIGLEHSRNSAAVMWPWYEGFKPNIKLNQDDINGIQSIYGKPKRQTKVVPTKPNICSKYSFDAVMYYGRTRNIYFFKGRNVWVMDERKKVGNHETISDIWPGLSTNLDAAYTRKDGDTIFFKGNSFWRYRGFVRIEGPKPLFNYIRNHLASRLHKIDAVMIWKPNGKTYFFSGHQYWRYDEQARMVEYGYPKNIALWRRVKYPVDDVMTWKNGKTFFFHRDKVYRFKNKKFVAKINSNQNKNKINHFIKSCRA